MKYRRWSVGEDVQGNVEDTGDEALAIQPPTEALADDLVEVGLLANTKLLVRFDLREFRVNRNHDWHGKISGGLIMPNEYVHHRADGDTAKFHRGAGIQTLQRCVKVKNGFELGMKKTARTEDQQRRDA